jgi:type VII secretion-associated serine protease mycosin
VKRTALVGASLLVAAFAIVPAVRASADGIRDAQWHLGFLSVTDAHRISRGNGVTVAVIDTGVQPVPSLKGNVLRGTVVDPAGSGDGRADRIGHGTAMAGLIAAHGTREDAGALGIAPEAKILPITDNVGRVQGSNDLTATAINWAVAHGAEVINISSGGGPSPALRAAVQAALEADVVVVASAGNKPSATAVQFPAFYPGVIAVGAVDRNGNLASISTTGRGVVITAPGVDITSTGLNGQYRKGTGTSDAAAIVSGAVALIRSKYPDLSAKEVVHRLEATAIDKGAPGLDDQYGYGVLNLVGALTADVPPLTPSPGDGPTADASPTGGVATGPSAGSGFVLTMTIAILAVIAAVGALFMIRSRARRRREGAAR